MFGFFPGVNGLTGKETNPLNTSDPNSKTVGILDNSPYIGPYDPDHGTTATTDKIFGMAGVKEGCTDPKMDGFIEFATVRKHKSLDEAQSLMNMFRPNRLPVMSALAENYAVFDRFFCSHPGPTWPNRLFQLMGTSLGCTATGDYRPKPAVDPLYPGRTVFDIVEEAGHDWAFYYADAPLELSMVEKLTLHPEKVKGWHRFKSDIRAGSLPAFSWVNPRWFVNATSLEGASDQHPDHDVRCGEALMKEVYEELRASPTWNSTLFIVTYDEHGGFYDHVPPPMNIPEPQGPHDLPSFPDKGFKFDRLGIRVPTLLISPWVPKGTVISEPADHEKPAGNSEFDLTSIISTVKNLLGGADAGVQPLTKRDAWAATFDTRLSEPSPRTDCPMHLPDAPKSLGKEHAMNEAALPLNDLQQDIINAFDGLRRTFKKKTATTSTAAVDDKEEALPTLQGEGSEWVTKVVDEVKEALYEQRKQ